MNPGEPVATTPPARDNGSSSATTALGLIGILLLAAAVFVPWAKGLKILDVTNIHPGNLAFSAEPILIPIVALIALAVPMPGLVRRGFLIALGLQTALMYSGYALDPLAHSYYNGWRPGGVIGLAGSALVLAAGSLAGRSTFVYASSPGAHPDPHAVAKPAPTQTNSPEKTCPDCGEPVRAGARICRFCRHSFAG
jgi:hypothetical protein